MQQAATSQSLWEKVVMTIHDHKVKRKIENIQSTIDHISKQKDSFGIASIASPKGGQGIISMNERLRWWRRPLTHTEEDDLVDLVEDTEALLTQLSRTEVPSGFYCTVQKKTLRRIIKDVNAQNIGDLEEVEEEMEVWESLEAAFPTSGMAGSKVMLTTRNREVALHADARSTPHEPRMLTEDESLELFRKKALLGMDHFPSDLKNLGREMVTKCGGLPLAAVVLGGLVSRKMKTREEWEHQKDSYPQQGEDKAEGVAENCLNELINRCMIQVGTLTSLGRVKTIGIHDLLRDFSLCVSREENFIGIILVVKLNHQFPHQPNLEELRYILTIRNMVSYTPFLNPYAPHLRSLHFFNCFQHPDFYFIKKDFKLLKVLDLKHAIGSSDTPSAIGILIQLRYLGVSQILKNCYIPPSIGNLKNLETLDLGSSYSPIPNVIWKMKRLRHLQTLKTTWAGRWIEDGGLANMISLRRLGIERLSLEKVNLVISILKRMCYLQSLWLEVMNKETFPTSMGLSHFQHLHKLCLKGKIEKLPHVCELQPNLVKLSLIGSELQKDSIVQLERLPYLKMLVLGNQSYKWRELEWAVEDNAMMKLEHLKIESCLKL
ncbi:hypothetical protein PRUPE_6G153200 [Prunus persica]|uniref:Uncharacterized protein n=1 Tax=Prunus persica TaxID=3760 RepID=A0A251NQU8_PRUPE|nr:hypothetical protein PRUPE_6G153200 [Prunus persica]